MPQAGTMMDLVTWLTFNTDLTEDQVLAEVQTLVAERRYVLTGNFAGTTDLGGH